MQHNRLNSRGNWRSWSISTRVSPVLQLGYVKAELRSSISADGFKIIYNEGWGQLTDYYPEFELTDRVRQLDPTRLVDSTTGWYDHGAGDFSVRQAL